jgi:hypothetical protein
MRVVCSDSERARLGAVGDGFAAAHASADPAGIPRRDLVDRDRRAAKKGTVERRIDMTDISAHFAVGRARGSRRAALGALLAALVLLVLARPALAGVSFSGPTNFPASENPASVAVGEFNGDSHPDLAVAGELLSVLLGRGDGGFEGPTYFNGGGPR